MAHKKVMLSGAVAAALIAPLALSSASAGTGGSDYNGILFGQSSLYCDSSLDSVLKIDGNTGQPLAGGGFHLTPQPQSVYLPDGFAPAPAPVATTTYSNYGIKTYTAEQVAAGLPEQDKALWVYTFNKTIDATFANTDYGKKYAAAQVQMQPDTNQTGASTQQGVWIDGTYYVPSETVLYPADITLVSDPMAQATALQAWPTMAGSSTAGTVSVVDFYNQLKGHVDAMGAVLYYPYNVAQPQDPHDPLADRYEAFYIAGSTSRDAALAEYTKAYDELQTLLAALHAAGYPDAQVGADGSLSLGDFNASAQDWAIFVEAYNKLTADGAYSFGFQPPTFDLIYSVIGADAVTNANNVANEAVNAQDSLDGVTDGQGKIYYEVFGRDVNWWVAGASDCSHLTVTVTEIKAPDGYAIDSTDPQYSTPTNLDPFGTGMDAVNAPLVFSDSLIVNGTTPQTPQPPRFEAGK